MKHLIGGALCVLIVAGPVAAVAAGKDQPKRGAAAGARGNAEPRAHASTSVHFEVEHVRVIREHYVSQHQLPPGLQKKYARTGQLPPGWQKKMEPIPVAIERALPPLPADYRRGVIDGHAVIYNSRSGLIIDVAVLF